MFNFLRRPPAWANTIIQQQADILKEMKMVDQALTDLQTADTALGTAVTNESNEINAATAGIASLLQQLVAASGNNDDAQVEAIAQDINNQISKINTSTSNLATAVATIPAPPAGNVTGNTTGTGTVTTGNTTGTGTGTIGNTTGTGTVTTG